MNPKKIAIVATALVSAALVSVSGAQAAKHPHHAMHHAHRHAAPNPVDAGAGLAIGAAETAGAVAGGVIASVTSPWAGPGWEGNYWAPSAWGDYDCHSQTFGCRPYRSWTQH